MAAASMGLQVVRNIAPRYYGSTPGYGDGRESRPCELVITLPGKYDLGVEKQANGTYAWVCDSELLSGSYGSSGEGRRILGENAERLLTRYGAAAVERDILKGAAFRMTVMEDDSIIYDVEESELARLGYQINT